METLSEALRFNPHWIIDPAVWRIIEQGDKEKLIAVANIQLEFTKAPSPRNSGLWKASSIPWRGEAPARRRPLAAPASTFPS